MTQLNSTALNTLKSLGFDTLIMSAELASALSAQTDAQNKFVNATSEALRLAVVEGVRPEHWRAIPKGKEKEVLKLASGNIEWIRFRDESLAIATLQLRKAERGIVSMTTKDMKETKVLLDKCLPVPAHVKAIMDDELLAAAAHNDCELKPSEKFQKKRDALRKRVTGKLKDWSIALQRAHYPKPSNGDKPASAAGKQSGTSGVDENAQPFDIEAFVLQQANVIRSKLQQMEDANFDVTGTVMALQLLEDLVQGKKKGPFKVNFSK
jgi:hypothetical protein